MSIEKLDKVDQKFVSKVEDLSLAKNSLRSLFGIEQFTSLRKLDLSYNRLTSVKQLLCIKNKALLEELDVTNNPLTLEDRLAEKLYANFKNLRRLNGQPKSKAAP